MKSINKKVIAAAALCSMLMTACNTQPAEETAADVEINATVAEDTTADNSISSAWEIRYFVDEFDQPTDRFFLYNSLCSGTFSNSDVSGEIVTALLTVYRGENKGNAYDAIDIALWEYDTDRVKNPTSGTNSYSIQILEENDDDKVLLVKGSMYSDTAFIHVINDKNQNEMLNTLFRNDKVTVRIDADDSMDTYLFEVDCTGLAELFADADWGV